MYILMKYVHRKMSYYVNKYLTDPMTLFSSIITHGIVIQLQPI